MVDYIFHKTTEYLANMPKDKRKAIGQFFTSPETARFMASMFARQEKAELRILDPGAGSGILTAAAIEHIQNCFDAGNISVTCYETNRDVLPLLKSNLNYIRENAKCRIEYTIIEENYITSQADARDTDIHGYDLVISNPPYKKIPKDAPEALCMPHVCYGAPNLYFLFAAMSLRSLKPDGEMVYIIPRSWTSGAYFRAFREYLFTNGALRHIHLFQSRDKVFESESVLQETIIVKVQKSDPPTSVRITCSEANNDFSNITTIDVPYSSVVVGSEKYVLFVTNTDDVSVLKTMMRWTNTLPSVGCKMRTGLTVDFRCKEFLRSKPAPDAVPLLYSWHLKDGRVRFPAHREGEYITTQKKGLIQRNKNYLLVKRFSSKEEVRRLQCGVCLSADLSGYEYISTQNKINFIEGIGFDLIEAQVYGLYVLFNSTLYDRYYRILNGSTQVNSTEINTIPVPTMTEIEWLGAAIMNQEDLSTKKCDKILEALYNGQNG